MCVCSQAIENDMDVQVQRFDDLNDRGQELAQLINSDPVAVERINNQLLEFQERWDNLVQQMEFQSKEVSVLLFSPSSCLCRQGGGRPWLMSPFLHLLFPPHFSPHTIHTDTNYVVVCTHYSH